MLILHANWSDGVLKLWGESFDAFHALFQGSSDDDNASALNGSASDQGRHPFAAGVAELCSRLEPLLSSAPGNDDAQANEDGRELAPDQLTLKLPIRRNRPLPSDRLVNLLGMVDPDDEEAAMELRSVRLPAVRVDSSRAIWLLLRLESIADESLDRGYSLRYWTEVARFVLGLLADQRFVPSMMQSQSTGALGVWQPWLHDEDVMKLVRSLHDAMPPIARAAVDRYDGIPSAILEEAMTSLADATIRRALIEDGYGETLEAIEDADDAHARWLRGLLGSDNRIDTASRSSASNHHAQERGGVELFRDVSRWIARLDASEARRELTLVLRLNEPDVEASDELDESSPWRLSFHLAADDGSGVLIDADDVWHHSAATPGTRQPMDEHPEEVLLAELTRAGRMCELIERALDEPTPTGVDLSTAEAHAFLREHQPVLEEAGIRVEVPMWWGRLSSRIGARLQLHTPDDPMDPSSDDSSAPGSRPALGLQALVDYKWEISLGDELLTESEFKHLMENDSPLVRLRGRWVELLPEDRKRAKAFLGSTTSGQMTLLEALQQVSGASNEAHALTVTGLDATGWFGELLNATSDNAQHITMLEQPEAFCGTLRPYQKAGLSWLAFLDRFGLGACLADDMGLGKTIQLIALLQHEREARTGPGEEATRIDPTLLIVPTSVVSNWEREIVRFAPELRVHVQHGSDRPTDAMFDHAVADTDVVITTYALVSRDLETLARQTWHRIVLDEAQYIKNPPTKQARAIRSIQTPRRIALTGTPVENRLSELWSIMEFCNPGYLGPSSEFRRRFAVPIERHRDAEAARMLRMMVRPFILRRLKSDSTVIGDLPPCVQSKEFATLTSEQASLYQQSVDAMLNEVESSNGIQRRGLILATLVKLKQICNHPLQLAGNDGGESAAPQQIADRAAASSMQHGTLVERSGKCRRLIELLEEVVASDEKALVFTQFRQMGHLLTTMIRAELDCDALFMHGGTPSGKRQQLIDRFQDARGGAPVFILSLKAGGLGLNLTAANHVFHFDRWWNPAVENQATDRAFRIGQTRTVQVHKFVCQGTLEERIDEMIEEKTELAENVIGAGEQWLTEMSTNQLRDLLMLRQSAMEVAE